MIASYVFHLTAVTLAPLAHGESTEGNEQVLRRQRMVAWDDALGDYRELLVPMLSGAALKATLREHAVARYLNELGIEQLGRDRLRLLLKGGRYEKGDVGGYNALEQWELRQNCPLLGVFGSMDAGTPNRGAVQVAGLAVWAQEAVAAGLQPAVATIDGRTEPVFADGRGPVALAQATHAEQRYRHDLASSSVAALLLAVDERVQAVHAAALAERRAGGGKVGALERRRANESMPYAYETISAGVPLIGEVRLVNATEVELWTLLLAIADWIRSGARVGGVARENFGALSVRVRGAYQLEPAAPFTVTDAAPMATMDAADEQCAGALRAHLADRRDRILAWLS